MDYYLNGMLMSEYTQFIFNFRNKIIWTIIEIIL